MVKLFAVYLGGSASRSNIELHDVVFVVGSSLESTYPKLKKKWFGYPEYIPHIDSYIELTHADGFQINLVKSKDKKNGFKLFFINYGGYSEGLFGEIHQSEFYVSKQKSEATQKARKHLCFGSIQTHLDDHLEVEGFIADGLDVDDILEIENVDGYFIECVPSDLKTKSRAHPGRIKIPCETPST